MVLLSCLSSAIFCFSQCALTVAAGAHQEIKENLIHKWPALTHPQLLTQTTARYVEADQRRYVHSAPYNYAPSYNYTPSDDYYHRPRYESSYREAPGSYRYTSPGRRPASYTYSHNNARVEVLEN